MSVPLRLHNTLSGEVEEFRPAHPGAVGMYVCGLTVYSRGHVGNYRSFVATDLLRRTLKYKGFGVREVMNITDVDDRIIAMAIEAGQDLRTFTEPHIGSFEEDMTALRLERPEHVPRATEHIPEMVDLISRLVDRGHTYTADGSVYFRIASFPRYGALARVDTSGIRPGARVDADKYDKENPRDFALWKAKSDEPEWAQWEAPFGRGRPGWHIECSAMSMKYLGDTLDLHCGGVDLVFPHHENEIAQSTCGTGKPFVRHWMHVQHLLVEGQTMSKSKGNVFSIPEIVDRGHRPEAIRYLLCSSHYRKMLNFTWEGLEQAAAALERIHGFVRRLDEVEGEGEVARPVEDAAARAASTFEASLSDDLNTPEALAAVHTLVSDGNALMAQGAVNRKGAARLRGVVQAMDGVLAVLMPEEEDRMTSEEQALFERRQDARRRRDWAAADAARAELEALGVFLEDTPKGTRWRRER